MNKNSNTYIIAYSCIMVVVVAFLLAFVSSSLKPAQDVNVALDKKKQILAALNIRNLSDQESAEQYAKVVDRDAVINADGKEIAKGGKGGETAGFLLNSADYKAGKLAVYYCTVDGKHKFVVPVYGMGLWGPIWGYIAVNEDCNTIYGAYFNHEGETAGLGAEIKDSKAWQDHLWRRRQTGDKGEEGERSKRQELRGRRRYGSYPHLGGSERHVAGGLRKIQETLRRTDLTD